MSVITSKEVEFLNVEIGGTSYPPNPIEVATPEMEDPYWEITYHDGTVLFASGNVFIATKARAELELVEGSGSPDEKQVKERVRKLHRDGKETKDAG